MALTKAERLARRAFIGSSDVPAIAGLSRWKGPHAIWMEKCPETCKACGGYGAIASADNEGGAACAFCDGSGYEIIESESDEQKIQSVVGTMAEPLLSALYEKSTGRRLRRKMPVTLPEAPWARASVDREGEDGGPDVELKMVGRWMVDDWGDEEDAIPAYYRAQVEWQMRVRRKTEIHVAALLGGTDFRLYRITQDRALSDELFALCADFRERFILARTPPPVDGTEAARAFLKRRFPSENGPMKIAPPEALGWIEELRAVKVEQKILAERRSQLEALIQSEIGDAEGIEDERWGKATWKSQAGGISYKSIVEEQRADIALVLTLITQKAPELVDPAMALVRDLDVLIATHRGDDVRVLRESKPKQLKSKSK